MQYYFSARHSFSDPDSLKRHRGIIARLKKLGHKNTNYVHMSPDSKDYKDALDRLSQENKSNLDVQLESLLNSDALICDLTVPSTTVGFQIATAIQSKIPCLALIFVDEKDKNEIVDPIILTQQYYGLVKYAKVSRIEELDTIIDQFAVEHIERPYKFNFFLPLSVHNAIAKRARAAGITKSELIRRIIDNYLQENTENA